MPERLTQKVIQKAIAEGRKIELRDAQARGLVLRVWGPGKWTWNIRRAHLGRDYRLDLGADWTLDEARAVANDAVADMRVTRGFILVEPDAWEEFIGKRRARRDGVPFKPLPPLPPPPPVPTGTTWRDAQGAWIAEIVRTRRETTAADYAACLRVVEFRPFHDKFVSTIRREEIAEAVAAISARGAERQAETCAIAVRRFFAWMAGDAQRRKYRVTPELLRDLKAPERSLDEDDSGTLFVPTGNDVGRIVRWLRDPDSAPERDRLAGLLLAYSVQRRRAVAKARVADFEKAGRHGGLWKLPALHRKSASARQRRGIDVGAHVVPLPPSAWAVVERAIELVGDSEYLFPGTRARREGLPVTTMAPETLTHMFPEIPDNQASPHDLRRAFGTTYARIAGLKLSDVKTILDHNEGVAAGDVTATHYAFLDGTHEKWPIMRGWCDWIDSQCRLAGSFAIPAANTIIKRVHTK